LISYLGIGSNIEPEKNILFCKTLIQKMFQKVRFSKTYKSQAVGFDGDDFYNLVAEIKDEQELEELIQLVKKTEKELGRVRTEKRFSSRHIDIDILLYGDIVCQQPIVLPRPEIYDNAYVLCPQGKTYKNLWQAFDKSRQPLLMID